MQFLDFLALWNKVQNVVERTAQKCSLQTRDDYEFTGICGFFREVHDIGEKLPLIDSDHIELHPRVEELGEESDSDCFVSHAAVGNDFSFPRSILVALISDELYPHDFLAPRLLSAQSMQQLSALTSKHRAQNELNAASSFCLN